MVSPYFNHVECTEEQDLYHDLARELIYLAGIEVVYVKVNNLNSEHLDKLFLENRFEELKKENCYFLDMWWDNPPEHVMGEEMFAKFGFSEMQTCRFHCAIRYFQEVTGDWRPEEGSYIFIPKWKNDGFGPEDVWKINFVDENRLSEHSMGSPLYYSIDCERARFTHQSIENDNINLGELKEGKDGDIKPMDMEEDNTFLEDMGKDYLEFDENNPFGMP